MNPVDCIFYIQLYYIFQKILVFLLTFLWESAIIQDHGHSYFSNSLIYGSDLENIMISGRGLITGGRFDEKSGILEHVLQGGDPQEPMSREASPRRSRIRCSPL